MISISDAIIIQSILIDKFGGTSGIRDRNMLESALMRPYQTFDGKELYDTPEKKAAAILESLVTNHPFIDGNKRFGYVAMRLLLMESELDIRATQQEKYDLVMSVAKGDYKYDDIQNWILKHIRNK
ncbi:MAG: type II toxin-antitoxin system death-on-curing family toxin [Clostridiaceae bacterium]|nr:type II toxin-antitoxin system death-on-curing family toxin [Clostridiaceae bacterium]